MTARGSTPLDDYPRLIFEPPLDDRTRDEAWQRGWLGHAKVEQRDGSVYPVVFYDVVRLGQDLVDEVASGRGCIADPGLIVIPEVTLENMTVAVRRLTREGFFDAVVPLPEKARPPTPREEPS